MIAHKLLDALTETGPRLYLEQVKAWMPRLAEWSE
jgi:hypothetical protein